MIVSALAMEGGAMKVILGDDSVNGDDNDDDDDVDGGNGDGDG